LSGNDLKPVVDEYFSILKDYFGEAFRIASRNEYRKERYRLFLEKVYDNNLIKSTLDSLFDELANLDWKNQETVVRNIGGLKAGYVGSEYGYKKHVSSTSEFLRKTCLYADTVVMEDQILDQLISWRKRKTYARMDFNFILEFAIEYLALEHLFLSDFDPPICTLAPSSQWILEQNDLRDVAWHHMRETTTACASELFDKTFPSFDDLEKFLSQIEDDRQFFDLIKNDQMLVTQDGIIVSSDYLRDQKRIFSLKYGSLLDSATVYETLLYSLNSIRINDLLYHGRLRSIPVTDYRATWNSLMWLMKHDSANVFAALKKRNFPKETLVISALQQEDLKWLGNVPINKIGALRENGELDYLRELIGKNVKSIENADDDDFLDVGQQVRYNIEQAMKKHDAEVKTLNRKYRARYKIDVSLAVSGALMISAAAFMPIASATSIAQAITGTATLRTVWDYLEQREKISELRTKPVAMLFDAKRVQQD